LNNNERGETLNSITKTLIILVMISLVGFTLVSSEENNIKNVVKESVLSNDGQAEVNASVISFIDKGTMTASWYGPHFHGKKTANGEAYNQMAFTAAHKKLRFGTLLRITNPHNNKSVIVRINDRGPYIRGRELDLSKASASVLGIMDKGFQRVKVDQISLTGVNFPVISLN
jgi:rare lipoprotein A (peptidoglycan hydrolase)